MENTNPAAAWKTLREGNQRFVAGEPLHPNQDVQRRAALAGGQQPIAVLFGCGDSRVAAEVIFDQGLGDMFVVRNVANLVPPYEKTPGNHGVSAAVEYAVHFLYDKLLGVMFWDYSGTHMDLNRRVCVPFAVVWGPLTAFALRQVQPLLHPIALHAPAGAGLALLLVLTADSFFTVRLLRRTHNVDLLGLPNLLASLR